MIFSFFFNDTATTKIYTDCHTLSLRDALPIYLLIVVPVALLIADLMFAQTGHYYVGEAKARHLLEDANPFSPRVWAWAAITGVWLFLTGLISGFYDNKAAYDRIPQRLRQVRWLRAVIGEIGTASCRERGCQAV